MSTRPHAVYRDGPLCSPYCPGIETQYHLGYAAGYRAATRARPARFVAPVTHGRHCPCSACARQDWSDPTLAPCGLHGSACPPIYSPPLEE